MGVHVVRLCTVFTKKCGAINKPTHHDQRTRHRVYISPNMSMHLLELFTLWYLDDGFRGLLQSGQRAAVLGWYIAGQTLYSLRRGSLTDWADRTRRHCVGSLPVTCPYRQCPAIVPELHDQLQRCARARNIHAGPECVNQPAGEYLQTESDIAHCSYKLLGSTLFAAHKDYVRRQIVHSLLQVLRNRPILQAQMLMKLQEDSPDTLHLIASFLLFDGRRNEATFEMMNEEGAFPRLLELIRGGVDDEVGLYKMLLELLYEMSRIQRLRIEDLSKFSTRLSGVTIADRVPQC